MNVFYTDECPVIAAHNLCNRHICKMGMEAVQMLSNAFPAHVAPYRPTHLNHPSSIWARTSPDNFDWLVRHAESIFEEYTKRYGRTHASWFKLCEIKDLYSRIVNISQYFPKFGFSPPPQCMPEQYRMEDAVSAYRSYYIGEKSGFAKWMDIKDIPTWWPWKTNQFIKQI